MLIAFPVVLRNIIAYYYLRTMWLLRRGLLHKLPCNKSDKNSIYCFWNVFLQCIHTDVVSNIWLHSRSSTERMYFLLTILHTMQTLSCIHDTARWFSRVGRAQLLRKTFRNKKEENLKHGEGSREISLWLSSTWKEHVNWGGGMGGRMAVYESGQW